MEKVNCTMGSQESKDTLDYCNNKNFCLEEKDDGNNLSGFSWPPRHYACTFCSRKFKSAQALGGHMNVHRRDRAMLRQPPSWVNLDFQNPNPNTSSSSLSATYPPYTRSLYSFSSSPSASSHGEKQHLTQKTQRTSPVSPRRAEVAKKSRMRSSPRDDEKLKGRHDRDADDDEFKVVRNGIVIRLDLEIGLLRDTSKEELDLELRLGCS